MATESKSPTESGSDSDPESELRMAHAFNLANLLTVAQLECGVPIPPNAERIEILKTIMGWLGMEQKIKGRLN